MSAPLANRFQHWFTALQKGLWSSVMAEYHALGAKSALTADIAVRARLWTIDRPDDPALAMAFDNGRRSLALEILELARADPAQIDKFIKSRLS